MLNILVKKNEYKQIVIAGTPLSKAKVSITELQEQLDITKSTFNRYVSNINEELALLYSPTLKIISDGQHLILENPNKIQPPNIFIKLLKHYINQSTGYKLLMVLSQINEVSSEHILEDLNVSHSYLNKVIRDLNDFFEELSIKIVQRNKMIRFEGPELNIITLLISLRISLWHYSADHNYINSDYTNFRIIDADLITPLNNLERMRLGHIEQVIFQRQENLDFIRFKNEDVRLSLQLLTQYRDLTQPNELLTENAILFINYICRMLCPQLDSPDDRVALAKSFLQNPTELSLDGLMLSTYIEKHILPYEEHDSEKYYQHIYQGMISFISVHLLQHNFLDILTLRTAAVHNFYIYNQPEFLKIRELFYQDMPFKQSENNAVFDQNREYFISGTYTAFREYKEASIKVILDFKYRLTFDRYLKKRLRDTFSDKMIHFVKDSSEADIIISDSFIEVPENQASFVFVDTNSTFAMSELLKLLLQLYTDRLKG